MAFGNTTTSANAILKEYYTTDKVEDSLFKDHAFLGMVSKKEDVDGRYFDYPVRHSAGQGRSASFTIAQTLSALSGDGYSNFQVPLVENHEIANISSSLLMSAPKRDLGAFVDIVTEVSDGQLDNLTNDLAISIYRPRSGFRARIDASTTIASSTIKVATFSDIFNFEQGMSLDVAATESSAGTRAYGSNSHGLYIGSVDYTKGTFTVAVSPSPGAAAVNMNDAADGCPAIAVADYLYASGDRNAKIAGLSEWLPSSVAANDSFMNVNRSINRVRLAGQYIEATNGTSIASAIEFGLASISAVGGRPDYAFMDHRKFAALSVELGAKATVVAVKATNAEIGYTGIKFAGPKGMVTAIGDLHCPADKIYLLDMSSWQLISQGKACEVVNDDGLIWLRTPNASGNEIRFRSYCGLMCKNPNSNGVLNVTAS